MNLATWRADPSVANRDLDGLAAALDGLTSSSESAVVRWGLHQAAFERL